MKNFVKAMDRNASGFAYLKQKISSISEAKIKEGIFVGPQIRELQQDGNFQNSLNEVEAAAWNSFRNVCKNFLESVKVVRNFRNGDTSLGDEEDCGRPSAVDNDHLNSKFEADTNTTTQDVAEEFNFDQHTAFRHLKQIGKVKKLDKWVPYELNENQKNLRFDVSSALLLRIKNEPFLDRIVFYDEIWILYESRRCSAQWLDRDATPKYFPKSKLHLKKIMVTIWWSRAGLIHPSFLNHSETITAVKYCRKFEEMHQNLCVMVKRKGPILLQDNAYPMSK
ncbi:SETMAR [Cordylochernes scorpioides]|uniref:SETMAR n=1 Tax=Cordylochernes scorpioides TaxID=51811 RepID=A0ABY6LVQ1_9ARAC|nr:SETMAR [Cordylochernes scorpioides]